MSSSLVKMPPTFDVLARIGRGVVLAVSTVVLAEVWAASPARACELHLGLGAFDVDHAQAAWEVAADCGFSSASVAPFGLVPTLGLLATDDGAIAAHAGWQRPFSYSFGRWRLTPSFSFTLFEQGDGKDLGGRLQFRSGLEVLRKARGGLLFGIGIHHLSNGGLSSHNPGANSLLVRVVPAARKRLAE